MKKKSTSQSAFFNLRILTASVFCLLGHRCGALRPGKPDKADASKHQLKRQPPGRPRHTETGRGADGRPCSDRPQMCDTFLTSHQSEEVEERRLTRYPFPEDGAPPPLPAGFEQFQAMLKKIWRPTPKMPGPLLTFDGITAAQSGCGCFPPDSNGDVGPNHYVNAVNSSFRVFDKSGNPLTPATTFNSLFAPLGSIPLVVTIERRRPVRFL